MLRSVSTIYLSIEGRRGGEGEGGKGGRGGKGKGGESEGGRRLTREFPRLTDMYTDPFQCPQESSEYPDSSLENPHFDFNQI